MKSLIFALSLLPFFALGSCPVFRTDGSVSAPLNDALNHVLNQATSCPTRVQELKALLAQQSVNTQASMVANRGRQNPSAGSFSFFERVTGGPLHDGEFFFGHFTAAQRSELTLDQSNANGKLMIELIVWDYSKGYYNFYEMIGGPGAPRWFYRGDSADILADTRNVNLLPQGSTGNPFGARLRCSGCHASGGPIMKELSAPHNDWWTRARPLPFGLNKPSGEVMAMLANIHDASEFAKSVHIGILKLESSGHYQAVKRARSWAEQLRPLFCENEINIASADNSGAVSIPSQFFAHPALAQGNFAVSTGAYQSASGSFGLRFPETGAPDADHAWLTPIRSFSDDLAVRSLIQQGVIDEKFALDVLAVDSSRPLFSNARCSLLSLVPSGPGWKNEFMRRLSLTHTAGAAQLLSFMSDPSITVSLHREREQERLWATALSLRSSNGMTAAVRSLIEVRAAVRQSPISRNPRGQILEPGFRVIFPTVGGR